MVSDLSRRSHSSACSIAEEVHSCWLWRIRTVPFMGYPFDEIQDVSVMPVSGWLDPQMNERFLRVVDEGIFERPWRTACPAGSALFYG